MASKTDVEKQKHRYTRDRIRSLLKGGVRGLYVEALDATRRLDYAKEIRLRANGEIELVSEDPSELVCEKADFERALAKAGLTEQQRAMASLQAMGWSIHATARLLHTDRRAVRALIDGSDRSPGLAMRLEAVMNGEEVP